MKKKAVYQLSVLLLLLLFVSCNQKEKDTTAYISVSIEPQRYFAEKIVGDKFKVKTIVAAGSSPEFFDPAPSQVVDFGKSKAYFMIGLFPFEKNFSKMLTENNPNVVLVNCSKDVVGIESSHSHDNNSHHSGIDPHIWSSPENAKIMSKNILDGILRLDPANRNFYEWNYKNLLHEIDRTDSLVQQKLKNITAREFIIFHPALTYFAKKYNLTQYSIEYEGKSLSPVRMSELVNTAKQKKIKTIFIQPEYDRKNAEVLAKEINGRVETINPLNYDWKNEIIKIAEALENQ